MEKEYTIIDEDGDVIKSFSNPEQAEKVAEAYSEAWDCDCHVENSDGKVVASFSR